ncbi:hypothetical protein ABT115_15120 [Streptomyces sp. NPDC001832]|uniref:hypothetical protein n=1 Tax=Streptomyces sp. NPDC001832 TaxID=3154527 RepID=UPI003333CCD8
MRTTTSLLAAAVALTGLTACSGSSDDDKATSSSGPETAVTTYTAAYFKGDATTAYEALSKRCKGKIGPDAYAGVVKQASTEYGTDHPATDVQADVSGDMARVTYKVKGLPKFDQEAQPWAREGGAWRYDAC